VSVKKELDANRQNFKREIAIRDEELRQHFNEREAIFYEVYR